MSKFLKGVSFIVVLGGVLFFSWKYMSEKEPIEITPEKVINREKIETQNIIVKKERPLFSKVDSLARLEFYKMHAVATEKILMVYFYADGCYYCEKMKNITFVDSRVQQELEKNYIVVSINYSRYKHLFRKEFHLHATPAIVFFDRDGKKIYENPAYGYQGAEDFYNKIKMLSESF